MNKIAFEVKHLLLNKLAEQGVTQAQFEQLLAGIDKPMNAVKVQGILKQAQDDDKKKKFDPMSFAGDTALGQIKGVAGVGAGLGVVANRANDEVSDIHGRLDEYEKDKYLYLRQLQRLKAEHGLA